MLQNYLGTLIIVCGDTPLLTTQTLHKLIRFHKENNSDLTVMTTKFDDPTGYGRIIRSPKDEILKIVEQKDATDEQKEIKEVNAGVYCVNWAKIRKAFNELKNNNAQGEYYLTDIIKWARDNQYKVLGYLSEDNEEIFGVNSRQHLAIASNLMKKRYLNELMTNGVTIVDPASTYISPDTTIEADTIIFPNTYIEGKNKIAKKCKIGPMAHLRGGCEVDEGCKIGNFVELKNAKIAKNSNVCHLSYIGDAEIGNHVNIGAGTIFANYNSITKEKKFSTVEDGASIGSNSVIVAPVHIGEDAMIAASSCITKDVEAHALALSRGHQKEIKNWVKSNKENK
jgi:bifunctional UDP-N-acetylglucosamine pyrophosphorylase/glucosamine-1-phosphate N-acetyltransferase